MRRALVVASQRGCPGPSSMGPVLGGWRPMGTESGEAPPSGAGRGRGVSPDQAGASEAPGSGAGRGKVASGSLFSRILEKPKERPRKEPAQAAGGGAASRSGIPSVSSEIGPDGSKVYRLRADRPGRFADPEAPDNREEGMRGDARAGSRRSRLASEDFALDAVRPRRVAAQGRPQGAVQRRPGRQQAPFIAAPQLPDDPDYFHIPSEWQTFVDLDTDPNISFEHLGSAPLSWEEARALRKKREAEDPLKRLEKFSPMFKELFDVSDEQLAQLSQVAVALHNNKRARDPAEGMDVKEQEEALRRAMEEIRGDRADRRADPAAEKLLHSLEHNRSIPYQLKKRMVEKFAQMTTGSA